MTFAIKSFHASALAVAALLMSPTFVAAQSWQPTEEITLVSQSSAGTGNDLLLREVSKIWVKNKMIPVSRPVNGPCTFLR